MSSDKDEEEVEATDVEFKSVCYTGIGLIGILIVVIGSLVFAIIGLA